MAHFLVGCQGSRGPTTRLAGKESGPRCWLNGWQSGVEVVAGNDGGGDNGDFFDVYATGGSKAAVSRVLVGQLRLKAGKLVFSRAK
jgi:hypothetical protein